MMFNFGQFMGKNINFISNKVYLQNTHSLYDMFKYTNKIIWCFNRILLVGEVGGIMGLCLGFSFLSLAEIFYFLTIRPLVNYCTTKRKMKKIDPTRISGNNLEFTNNGENRFYL